MNVLNRSEWAVLGALVIYSFIPVVGGLIRLLELAGGPAIAPENLRALAAPVPVILHILSSTLFCTLGAIQFLPSVRRHHPAAHRCSGRVAVAAGCVSAGTGLWMTHFFSFPADLQGDLLYAVRMILGCVMIGHIAWAVVAVRSRNISGHRAAMLRAYAIGQGASTQSILGIAWIVIQGTEPLGLARDSMMVIAWMLNLVAAELVVQRVLKRKPGPSSELITHNR